MVETRVLYVPDASVILKWALLDERDNQNALKMAEDFIEGKIDLMIPSHCYFEVLNIINLKSPELAEHFFSQLLGMNILEQRLTLEIVHLSGDLMDKIPKISFYDAAYHATAISNGGLFITADEKYYKKAKKFESIKLLADY